MIAAAVATLALWALPPATPPAAPTAQDGEQEPADVQAEIERFLHAARTGRAHIRPQAARALAGLGAPAAERLLAEAGETNADLAALGQDLVEVLGEFDEPRLRARLWTALNDPDFPWRPAAARALASTAEEDEAASLARLSADPLAAVRAAAIEGLRELDLRDEQKRLERLLSDEDDRVRRAAATLLDEWGQHWALAWLLEDLKREDAYFSQRNGKQARYEALRLLKDRFGDAFGYDPERATADPEQLAALEKMKERIQHLTGSHLRLLPEVARAGAPTEGDVIGIELRSCRKGEYFLRWNEDDVLYVGLGNASRVDLPEGTVASLLEAGEAAFGALGKQRMWGEPGCDLEQFHWRPEGEGRTRTVRISKGPDAVEGLRPEALTAFARQLVATLPEDGEGPRLDNLRARVEEALAALGGELE